MHIMGIFEAILFFTLVIALLGMIVVSIRKFYNCKIPVNKKILWIIFFLISHLLGLIVFLYYHEYYLSPELRETK